MSWFFSKTGNSIESGLVEYWNLDEASGTRFGEITGAQLAANGTPSVAGGAPDGVDTCAAFSNPPGYTLLNSTSPLSLPAASFSFFLWVYLTTSNGSTIQTFVAKNAASQRELALNHYNGSVFWQMALNLTTWGIQISAAGTVINTWYSVYAAFDSSLLQAQLSLNNGTLVTTAQATRAGAGTQPMILGINPEAPSHYHNGRMSRLGLWSRVLTPTERTYLHNSGTGRAYPFS